MRVSIWRQFSNNHSADFTVVGQFESAEWAELVGQELREMLRTIGAWWETKGDWKAQEAVDKQLRQAGELAPPEKVFEAKYGVGWTQYPGNSQRYPLDWVTFQGAAEGVQVYRNLVFVSPPGNTWAGARPFDVIIEKLGGQAASDVEDDQAELVVTLSFNVQDEATAESMVQRMAKLEGFPSPFVSIPGRGTPTPGIIERDGKRITIRNLWLHDIEYTFSELSEDDYL